MTAAKRYGLTFVVVAAVFALGFYVYTSYSARSQQPAVPATPHTVTLSWDKMPHAASYNIYRRPYRGDAYEKLGSSTTTTYADPNAMSAERYCYQVTAVDSKKRESARSREFCITVPQP